MSKKSLFAFALFSACAMAFTSCKEESLTPEIVQKTTGHEQWLTKIDYSDRNNWLNIPSVIDKSVDVIYYYPTCYTASEGDLNLCGIDNAGMRAKAAVQYRGQATAFAGSCNIYAPFYRQLDVSYALTITNEENAELIRYAASKDASDALDYYFANFNEGRPFILAGHSQGSETSLYLLVDYFKAHPEYYKRMVAAYIIGYSVTSDILAENPHMKFAQGADDTGVIVSWNTEGPENKGQHNAVLLPNAVSINPINWKLDGTRAEVAENLGSLDLNGILGPGIADAQIDTERGSVICTSVDPATYSIPMAGIFGPQCYHAWDYGLFYANIGANAEQRIAAFLK